MRTDELTKQPKRRYLISFLTLLLFVSLWSLLLHYNLALQGLRGMQFFYRQLIYLVCGVLVFWLSTKCDLEWNNARKNRFAIGSIVFGLLPLAITKFSDGQVFPFFPATTLQIYRLEALTNTVGWLALICYLAFAASILDWIKRSAPWLTVVRLLPLYLSLGILFLLGQSYLLTLLLFIMTCLILLQRRLPVLGAGFVFANSLLLLALGLLGAHSKGHLVHIASPEDRYGITYQLVQSLLAIRRGGFVGIASQGESKVATLLPMARTDYLASYVTEQYGLIGLILMITVCFLFFLFGLKASRMANGTFESNFTALLVLLCTALFCLHISVCLGRGPVMGVPMPFFSTNFWTMLLGFLMAGVVYRHLGKDLAPPDKREPIINNVLILTVAGVYVTLVFYAVYIMFYLNIPPGRL